eukprot:251627-Rhodomonas_salina.2
MPRRSLPLARAGCCYPRPPARRADAERPTTPAPREDRVRAEQARCLRKRDDDAKSADDCTALSLRSGSRRPSALPTPL